jgi:hypothetical protein
MMSLRTMVHGSENDSPVTKDMTAYSLFLKGLKTSIRLHDFFAALRIWKSLARRIGPSSSRTSCWEYAIEFANIIDRLPAFKHNYFFDRIQHPSTVYTCPSHS